jgi:hypothetical protein
MYFGIVQLVLPVNHQMESTLGLMVKTNCSILTRAPLNGNYLILQKIAKQHTATK